MCCGNASGKMSSRSQSACNVSSANRSYIASLNRPPSPNPPGPGPDGCDAVAADTYSCAFVAVDRCAFLGDNWHVILVDNRAVVSVGATKVVASVLREHNGGADLGVERGSVKEAGTPWKAPDETESSVGCQRVTHPHRPRNWVTHLHHK